MTKTKLEESLEKALDIASNTSIVASEEVFEAVEVSNTTVITQEDKRGKDLDFARDNLYEMIGKGQDAFDTLLRVAKVSEHPRAFEVVSTLIKTLADTNKDLIQLHEKEQKMKNAEEVTGKTSGTTNIENALFVGTAAELQKHITRKNNSSEEEDV